MRYTIQYYLICIFLFAPFLIKAQAEDFILIGDSLFAREENSAAALCYERAYYHSSDVKTSARAVLKKVYCLKKLNQFNEAQKQLDKLRFDLLPIEVHPQWRFEGAYCAFMNHNYERAQNEITMYEAFTRDTIFLSEMLFLKVLICINTYKWKEAHAALDQYINRETTDSSRQKDLLEAGDAFFEKPPKQKNPDKARRLSIIPGLGQCYSGYPGEGAISFGLNASALAFGVYNVLNGYPLTGYFTGAGMLQAFYFGGQNRAAALSVRRNEKTRKLAIKKMINIMVEAEKY